MNYFKSKKYKNKSTTLYDSELQTIYKTKQRLYKKFMKKPNEMNKNKYAQIRNYYDRLVKNKKQVYIQSKLVENKKSLKKTWQIINQLLGKSKIKIKNQFFINNELISNDVKISNRFNTYFSTIAENLVKKIPWTAAKFADFLPQPTLNTIFFKPTSAEEIQSIITTMKPKSSCDIDDIPSKVSKIYP